MGNVQKYTFSIRQRKKKIIIGKLVAASKKASFEIRYKQEQLVEVAKNLVLFIGSDDCLLKFSGQMIIESEDVPGFSPNFLCGLNNTLCKNRHSRMGGHKYRIQWQQLCLG